MSDFEPLHRDYLRIPHREADVLDLTVTVRRLQIEKNHESTFRASFLSRNHLNALLAHWNRDSRWKYWSETI